MSKEEQQPVIDAIVIQQSGKHTLSYIHEGNMWNILQCGGLTKFNEVALLDTEDRPVDSGIKDGTDNIADVLIPYNVLMPNITVYLG